MENCLDSPKLKIDVLRLVRGLLEQDNFEATLRLALTDAGLCPAEEGDTFHVSLVLERLHGGIRVHGTVKGTVTMECSRCLERFGQTVNLNIDEVYRLQEGPAPIRPPASSEVVEDDSYVVYEGILDLNAALSDAIMLSVPMKPLCRQDCKGLCASCGGNLNVEDCDCVTEEIDPRLAVLRRLLDRDQG
jgi:uncharacterized protein